MLVAFKMDGGDHVFRRLLMSGELSSQFREMLGAYVENERARISRGTTRLLEHSPGYKPAKHEIAWTQKSEVPFLAAFLEGIPNPDADVPVYQAEDEELLEKMSFFVIDAELPDGSNLRAFSRITKSKEVTRGHLKGKLPASFQGDRFDTLEETTLVFEPRFFAIEHDAYLFILTQHYVEQAFGYIDKIRDVAESTLTTIEEKIPIANFDEFEQAALRHPNKIRKLRTIHNQAYLEELSVDQIEEEVFSRVEPDRLGVGITDGEDGKKLVYDPDHPWALLTLLEDKFVEGLLSHEIREANSTRPIDND